MLCAAKKRKNLYSKAKKVLLLEKESLRARKRVEKIITIIIRPIVVRDGREGERQAIQSQ